MRWSDPLTWLIRGYQRMISRYTPPVCRFTPSCCHYALGALQQHGPLRGSALAAWRILRCNPLFPGGHDPVPAPACACPPGATAHDGGARAGLPPVGAGRAGEVPLEQ